LLEENITNVILPDSVKDESDSNEEENEEDLYQFAED
jgi:hypothetical protein